MRERSNRCEPQSHGVIHAEKPVARRCVRSPAPCRPWRPAVLRTVAAYLFAVALLLLSPSAFRQALSELRQTEPGSLLFGVLQLVIGTAAVLAAIGLVKRARWAAGAAAVWGVATAALLAVQPLFTPMDADARWSIWLAAAALGVAAAGVSWFARGLARSDAASHASAERASIRE